ncbi:MAG TPA: hypothetical protein VM577_10260 [Anaerovoracaceae bacterium]|nr:hypothetical protein [Anaerovoracaceae bacterium]
MFVIIGIILYVFMALGMQAMATKLKIENPWLAWIPIANVYLMGRIAGDQVKIFNKNIPKLGLVLLIGGICIGILTVVPVINLLACIAYAVIYCVALYKIYRIFAENNAVLYTILSIVIDVTAPFFIYFASKNEPNPAIFNEGKTSGFSEAPSAAQSVIPEPTPNPVPSETPSEEKIEE